MLETKVYRVDSNSISKNLCSNIKPIDKTNQFQWPVFNVVSNF